MVNYKDAFDFSQGTEWAFAKPLPIVGSHDSNVRIKTSGFDGETDAGKELHIDGNLVKFFQGHNLLGYSRSIRSREFVHGSIMFNSSVGFMPN